MMASPLPSLCPRLLHVHCVHCVLRRHHGLSASLTLSSFTTHALRALCAAAASWPFRLLHSVLVYYTCTVCTVCCGGITALPPPSLCPRLLHVHCVHCVLRRHHGLSASFAPFFSFLFFIPAAQLGHIIPMILLLHPPKRDKSCLGL
jgi:hypothetical protein